VFTGRPAFSYPQPSSRSTSETPTLAEECGRQTSGEVCCRPLQGSHRDSNFCARSVSGGAEGRKGRQGRRRDRLVSLLEESRPVSEGARHHARVDEVELLAECPRVVQVVNLKSDVGWDAVMARGRRVSIAGGRTARDAEGKTYNDGCIGLRSTPMTLAERHGG
jgi:hypothetical protein